MTQQPVKVKLERGGVIINTKIGAIQFGIPPETIKDCMNLGIPIPNWFVFPAELFDRTKGINVAEAEFPAYFNYFICKKVVNFVSTREQEHKIREVFQQTLLGPRDLDIRKEFPPKYPESRMPDLAKECGFIRTFHSIDELFRFTHFNEGVADVGEGLKIVVDEDDYVVFQDGVELERTPRYVTLPSYLWQGPVLSKKNPTPTFDPPLFGVTILGSGHGFDPSHRTTGFVLWINKRGIMVDPPLNSRGLLQSNGVPSRLVDSVIITHCHADHDQGTFQKLLEETQINLYTTPTILKSFLIKYSALTGLFGRFLKTFVYFQTSGYWGSYED